MENSDSVWIIDLRATSHVCSSLQRVNSWRQLKPGEMALKVGIGEVVSAVAVGSIKLFFQKKFMLLDNVYIVPRIKRNLIYVSKLIEQGILSLFPIIKYLFLEKELRFVQLT